MLNWAEENEPVKTSRLLLPLHWRRKTLPGWRSWALVGCWGPHDVRPHPMRAGRGVWWSLWSGCSSHPVETQLCFIQTCWRTFISLWAGQWVYLDELSDHSRSLGGTRSGQSGHTLSDGAVRLLVRQSGRLGVNWTGQHPQQIHVTQTGRLCGHQSLNTRDKLHIIHLTCFKAFVHSRENNTSKYYLVEVQHCSERPALQQRGSNQRDELLEDVSSAQLTQRGRVSHRQRGEEAQRHLRHVHVALWDERRQLGEDGVHHDRSHRRAETETRRWVYWAGGQGEAGCGVCLCVCLCVTCNFWAECPEQLACRASALAGSCGGRRRGWERRRGEQVSDRSSMASRRSASELQHGEKTIRTSVENSSTI